MKKNFNYRGNATRAKDNQNWLFVLGVIAFLLLIGLGFFFTSKEKGWLTSYVERAKVWMVERKTNLNHGMKQVKKIVAKKHEAPPVVHFEFYTALSDMKIKPVEAPPTVIAKSKTPITNAEQLEQEFAKEFKKEK